jgi:YVTN family beta-propeller protein
VTVINAFTNHVTATIPVGFSPFGVAANSVTSTVYVANIAANTVSVINGRTNQVIATVPTGIRPFGMAVNTLTGRAYVSNSVDNTVQVIALPGRTATGREITRLRQAHPPPLLDQVVEGDRAQRVNRRAGRPVDVDSFSG